MLYRPHRPLYLDIASVPQAASPRTRRAARTGPRHGHTRPSVLFYRMVKGRLRKFYAGVSFSSSRSSSSDQETKISRVRRFRPPKLRARRLASKFCAFALGEGIERQPPISPSEVGRRS